MTDRPDLLSVHGALSSLLYATTQALKGAGVVDIHLTYRESVYLQLHVEVRSAKNAQIVVDRLLHGVLFEEYDYRFKCVSHSTFPEFKDEADLEIDKYEPYFITAQPDMCFDANKIKGTGFAGYPARKVA